MAANPQALRNIGPRVAPTRATRTSEQELGPLRKFYRTWSARIGMLLAAAAIVIGYDGRDSRRLFAEEGLGYALGVIGTLMILTLLLYPLRKRIRILKFLGPVKNWFRMHMLLGVIGSITILYHANFSLGSVNSNIALISMLLVATSGLVGRFLYAKVHHGLYGRKANLKELLAGVRLTTADAGAAAQFVPNLMQQIAEFDRQVLKPPKNVIQAMFLPLRLSFQTRRGSRRIVELVAIQLEMQAHSSPVVAQHQDRMIEVCSKYIREHLRRVRRVASFAAYERLFSLWHKIHLPFFYIMLITVVVHVIAVHIYSV